MNAWLTDVFGMYYLGVATMVCINVIIVSGLNLITGITGQLSLGHAAFMSLGAYFTAIVTTKFGVPFFLSVPMAVLFAALIGALLGLPILRMRGDYLAIATLGFGEIVRVVILNMPIANRALGIYGIPPATTFVLAAVLMVVALLFCYRLEHSRVGLALRSIRDNEIAAEMMGVDIARYKILAFTVGSGLSGLGGVLYAHHITYISPNDFGFMKSIEYLSMLVLGGLGSLTGVVAGSLVLTTAPEVLRFLSEYRMIMYGGVLVLIMIFRPQGIFGKIKAEL